MDKIIKQRRIPPIQNNLTEQMKIFQDSIEINKK
jgi:hypothetical protein